jgi:hypothetical protein
MIRLQKTRDDFFEFGRTARFDFYGMHIDAGFILRFQSFKTAFDSTDVSQLGKELL